MSTRRAGMRIRVRVHDREALRETRKLRREIGKVMREEIASVAGPEIIPTAERLGPSIARGRFAIRASRGRPYLTTTARGMKRRTIGLLEYGGTVRTELRPKRAQALRLRDGRFVSRVSGPRKYSAQKFMARAVDQRQRAVSRALRRSLVPRMRHRLRGIARVS